MLLWIFGYECDQIVDAVVISIALLAALVGIWL